MPIILMQSCNGAKLSFLAFWSRPNVAFSFLEYGLFHSFGKLSPPELLTSIVEELSPNKKFYPIIATKFRHRSKRHLNGELNRRIIELICCFSRHFLVVIKKNNLIYSLHVPIEKSTHLNLPKNLRSNT